jgi:uncharacterized protein YdeI (YjbR/CyaY-like superfamily)
MSASKKSSSNIENGLPTFHAPDRATWRKWLAENHGHTDKIWLILCNKGSGIASISYPEAVEEALCYGWIDSKAVKRDAQSRYQSFSRRNPKSVWSKLNKSRVEKLLAEGRMAPAGMAMVKAAKDNGMWDYLNEVEEAVIPSDLQAAFDENAAAWGHWNKFPPSTQKQILHWILDAKRPETRAKRIAETVELAAKGLRAQ